MTQSLLQIPLDIPDVRIEKVETTPKGELIITVSSTLTSATCHQCGQTIDKFYGYGREITLRHLSIFDRPVWIKLTPKRYQCPDCPKGPTTTQQCNWYDWKSPHTKAYEQWILRELINSTVTDMYVKHGISAEAAEGIINRYVTQQVDWSTIQGIRLLGLDEIALKKGHQDFVVIVSAIDTEGHKRILAVLPDRKKETVKAFLQSIPKAQQHSLQRVCVDMYEGYRNAVYETLPGVEVVVDRFHVAKHYRDGADQVRKVEMKKLKNTLSAEDYAKLKGAMWAFRKRWIELSADQQAVLLFLFQQAPILREIYIQRELLTGIFERQLNKAEAEKALDRWIAHIKVLKLKGFEAFVKTYQNWRNEITNYFIRRETSGFVEGLNNKIKSIKRRCFGIYNTDHLFQHIWLDIEGRRLFGYA
jgi:transposase